MKTLADEISERITAIEQARENNSPAPQPVSELINRVYAK